MGNKLNVLLLELLLCIVFFTCASSWNKNLLIKSEYHTIQEYNKDWVWIDYSGEKNEIQLPCTLDVQTGSPLILEKDLTGQSWNGESLAFYTNHQFVKVYLGHTLIYDFTISDSSEKTPGNAWHFVTLPNTSTANMIRIEMTCYYKDYSGKVPKFMIGEKSDLIQHVIKEKILSLFICGMVLVVSAVIVICHIFFRRRIHMKDNVAYLGFLGISMAVWMIAETQLLPIYLGHHLFFSQVALISLCMMQQPFVRVVSIVYGFSKHRYVNYLCNAGTVVVVFIIFMQLFHLADLKETLVVTHLLFAVTLFFIITMVLLSFHRSTREHKKRMRVHVWCIVVIAIMILLDTIMYYTSSSADSALFSRIGVYLYIVMLLLDTLVSTFNLMKAGEEAESLKVMAYQDALTKLKNRYALKSFLSEIESFDYDRYSIVMFDLNELKKVNDYNGHLEGDQYILKSGEAINKVFGEYGTVYRIGGDEFCALLKDFSIERYDELCSQLDNKMKEINEKYFNQCMGTAYGIATFDCKIDYSLEDTRNRADILMYQNKEWQKQKLMQKEKQ